MEYFKIESKFFIDTVNFSITYRCNFNCPCCYQHKSSEELCTEDALKIIDKLGKWRIKTIMFGGGEPLLRTDLPLLIQRAHIYAINVFIGTNGSLLDKKLAFELKDAGTSVVFLGIDDPLNPTSKEKKDIDYASRVAMLHEAGIKTIANLIVTHQMVRNLEEVLIKLKKMDFDGVNLLRPRPDSASGEWYLNALLTPADIKRLHLARLRLHHKLNSEIGLDCSFGMLLFGIFSNAYYQQLGSRGCGAARGYFHIDPIGHVFPCPYLSKEKFKIGNFLDNDFARKWIESPVVKLFSNSTSLKGKCHECYLRDICFGCRALALYEKGDMHAEDPHCPFGEALSIREQIAVYKEVIKIVGPELLS